MVASNRAMTSGTKIVSPSRRATMPASRASTLSPIRVAVVRLKFIRAPSAAPLGGRRIITHRGALYISHFASREDDAPAGQSLLRSPGSLAIPPGRSVLRDLSVLSLFTASGWHGLRRAGTQSAVRAALRVSRRLGPAGAVRLGAALGTAARWALPLRRRLAATLCRAGIRPTAA